MTRPYRKDPAKVAERIRKKQAVASLFREGKTQAEIGSIIGCTRQYISLCLLEIGVAAGEGGGHRKMLDRQAKRIRQKDEISVKKHGCDHAQYIALRDMKKPLRAFSCQKRTAHQRGIGWDLTLWQWWTIWQESGKWSRRGVGQGYVMCRIGDEGPYAIGNVFIAPNRENSAREYCKTSGLPIGVSARNGRFIAMRMIDGKRYRLGSFSTPHLAHKAYLSAYAEVSA